MNSNAFAAALEASIIENVMSFGLRQQPAKYIPLRVLEVGSVNGSFDWKKPHLSSFMSSLSASDFVPLDGIRAVERTTRSYTSLFRSLDCVYYILFQYILRMY